MHGDFRLKQVERRITMEHIIDQTKERKEIFRTREKVFTALFIVIALLSGWIGLLIDKVLPEQVGEQSLGMGIWLVLPFLCGVAIRAFSRDWKDFGVKPRVKGNIRWYGLALLVFPVVMLLFTLIAWVFGLVHISSFSVSAIVPVVATLLLGMFIKNIFEDFAWQGYLTPKLVKTDMKDWKIYLVVGLVWAFWHAPYYLYFLPEGLYSTSMERVLDTIVFSPIVITIWAVIFVEITRLTGSVWPAVLMHAVEDTIPNFLIFEEQVIQFTKVGELLFNPLRGILPLIAFLIIGLWLRKRRIARDGEPLLTK